MELPLEVEEMQTNLDRFENRLSELNNLRSQYIESKIRYEIELRNIESALNRVNADAEACESDIAALRPKIQSTMEDARQRRCRQVNEMRQQESINRITCTICLEEIDRGSAYSLECGHVFHQHCVERWLKQKKFMSNM